MTAPEDYASDPRWAGWRDPREHFRTLLRELKEKDADAYRNAVADFQALQPALESSTDPIRLWRDYGRKLSGYFGPGERAAIMPNGLNSPDEEPTSPDTLLLYLPIDRTVPARALWFPESVSPAQDAVLKLLVQGRLTL